MRASRVTYVGELGWELYVPTEFAAGVYDALVAAGEDLGPRATRAITPWTRCASRRRIARGATTSAREDTPLQAGLGFAVRLDKRVRPSSAARRCSPSASGRCPAGSSSSRSTIPSRCSTTTSRSGATASLVGRITSGAYGHTLGRAVGLGYVDHADGVTDAFVASGRWELEVACERLPARAQLTPPYDPKSLRVRADARATIGPSLVRPPLNVENYASRAAFGRRLAAGPFSSL